MPILARVFALLQMQLAAASSAAFATGLAAASLLVAFPMPSFAASSGPTRKEYVEEVEQICKSETAAHRSILSGVEDMVNRGRLKQAAPHLMKAAAALRAGVRKVAAVPRPLVDAERLEQWFGFSSTGVKLLRKAGLALRKGNRPRVQRLANQLFKKIKRANATVVGFNFNYCRVKPARFV